MKQLLLILMLLLVSASCTRDDPFTPDGDKTAIYPNVVTFDISIGNGKTKTKAYTDANFKSYFSPGDTIGVFAVIRPVDNTASLQSADNYAHNKAYIRQANGTWEPATVADNIFYPSTGNVLDFYAYYPYINKSDINPRAVDFTVSTMQADTTNYNRSDLMCGINTTGYDKEQGANPVRLNFKHSLGLVQVKVPSQVKGFGPSANLIVTLRGVQTQKIFDIGDWDLHFAEKNSNTANITMYRVEQSGDTNYETSYTYRALIPAQQIAVRSNLFWFEHEGRQIFVDEPLVETLSILPGDAKVFTRSLPESVSHTVKISAGTFFMGSPDTESKRESNETQHRVHLTKDFYMSKYEVTNAHNSKMQIKYK